MHKNKIYANEFLVIIILVLLKLHVQNHEEVTK